MDNQVNANVARTAAAFDSINTVHLPVIGFNPNGPPRRLSPLVPQTGEAEVGEETILAAMRDFVAPVLDGGNLRLYRRLAASDTIDQGILKRVTEDSEAQDAFVSTIHEHNGAGALRIIVNSCSVEELRSIMEILLQVEPGSVLTQDVWKIGNLFLMFGGLTGGMEAEHVLREFHKTMTTLVLDHLAKLQLEGTYTFLPENRPDAAKLLEEAAQSEEEASKKLTEDLAKIDESAHEQFANPNPLRFLTYSNAVRASVGLGFIGGLVLVIKQPETMEVVKTLISTPGQGQGPTGSGVRLLHGGRDLSVWDLYQTVLKNLIHYWRIK